MKDTLFTLAVEQVIQEDIKAIDAVIQEDIEPLAKVGNPETLINKKYENWTPQDFQTLTNIYGQGDDTPLARLIFNKSYEELKTLESEV